jgi:hypothetical protein
MKGLPMKNRLLASLSLLVIMAVGQGFADTGTNALSYADIVAQYTAHQPIANVSGAIKVIEMHRDTLRAQRSGYSPMILKTCGMLLGFWGASAALLSTYGAVGSYMILNSPENSFDANELFNNFPRLYKQSRASLHLIPLNQKGLNYSQSLQFAARSAFYEVCTIGRPSRWLYEENETTKEYLKRKSSENLLTKPTVMLGHLAPFFLAAAVVELALSRYLLNKAEKYRNEPLETLISQDEQMIIDLRAQELSQ